MQVAQVSGGGYVKERFPVRTAVQLVQDPLFAPGTAAAAPPTSPPAAAAAHTSTPITTAAPVAPDGNQLRERNGLTFPTAVAPAFSHDGGAAAVTPAGARPDPTVPVGHRCQAPFASGRGQQQLRDRRFEQGRRW